MRCSYMIRLAKHKDLTTIDKLAERAILNMQDQGIPQWTLDYPRKSHFQEDVLNKVLYVFEKNGQILGCMAIKPEHDEVYYMLDTWVHNHALVIHRVIVAPEALQLGIASDLMNHAKKLAIKNGYDSIRIDTHLENYRMKSFIVKHGFKERGYLEAIDRYAYEWCVDTDFLKKIDRVVILGASGTGKTTACQKIADKYGLVPLHLDSIYWKKDWNRIEKDDFQAYMVQFFKDNRRFVIDGNYTNNKHFMYRIQLATTIILLDYGTQNSLKGIYERAHKFKHSVRPDMPEGCLEGIDQVFLKYVAGFNQKNNRLKAHIKKYENEKQLLIFKSRKELNAWFNQH